MRFNYSSKRDLYYEKAMTLYFEEGMCGMHICKVKQRKIKNINFAGAYGFDLSDKLKNGRSKIILDCAPYIPSEYVCKLAGFSTAQGES